MVASPSRPSSSARFIAAAMLVVQLGCNQILGIGDIHEADDAAVRATDAPDPDAATPHVDANPDARSSPDAKPSPPDANNTTGMALVPAGLFERGCNNSIEDCSNKYDEVPLSALMISAFHIDITEATQFAYRQCVDAHACTAPSANFDPVGHGDYPVVDVTWAQAATYCAWAGKRLPTEAEWEKAARGTDARTYPWGNGAPTCTLALWLNCPGGTTSASPVNTHPSGGSPYVVQDMAGNVSEWVNDWYDNNYYATAPSTDPQGPSSGTYKVVRGGGWDYGSNFLRAANRDFVAPTYAADQIGFRCAHTD